jgi:predicted RNA-binding Zn-ribbon protein involved in translation (DUF1610 family)
MPKRKRKKPRTPADPDAGAYTCPTCGEQIIIPLDPSQGRDQTYTEDCPVCCHPNIIHVESDPDWTEPRIWAESE